MQVQPISTVKNENKENNWITFNAVTRRENLYGQIELYFLVIVYSTFTALNSIKYTCRLIWTGVALYKVLISHTKPNANILALNSIDWENTREIICIFKNNLIPSLLLFLLLLFFWIDIDSEIVFSVFYKNLKKQNKVN